MSPRDFTNFTLLIQQPLAPTIIHRVSPGSLSNLLMLFGVLMIMNSVLTVLRLSLFMLNHLQILESAGTRCSFISSTFLSPLQNLYHQQT